MSSNSADLNGTGAGVEVVSGGIPGNQMPKIVPTGDGSYCLKIFRSSLNLLAHLLIGIVVGVSLLYCFRGGLPLGTTAIHIVLCVIGFQLLMSEAILSLCPYNGWSNYLRLTDKKRTHAILQMAGSILALAGCFIMSISKNVNFNTLHGKFALVAMVFTVAGFLNGWTSWYSQELRNCLPPALSKITHIVFGIVAYAMSAVTLCYGLNKGSFRGWASEDFTYTLMAFTGCFTFICIISPLFNCFSKTAALIK
ncbi:uncharacterized protein LOC116770703 [Danaus plexippus]|uniref:uncharacterized protein LOC116770703 n=1 Tax=Danaus plexippus TaxID=13037 RepID=UPI002AAF86BB|nr:uncharacterized protein LOC116770703 [Danaus plexippus]